MTDTTQPDTPTLIATLYELSDGGKAEWWPGEIEIHGTIGAGYRFLPVGNKKHNILKSEQHRIKRIHALDIIRGSAERWLRARGWNKIRIAHEANTAYWIMGEDGHSLADAIRSEMGRETKNNRQTLVQSTQTQIVLGTKEIT